MQITRVLGLRLGATRPHFTSCMIHITLDSSLRLSDGGEYDKNFQVNII